MRSGRPLPIWRGVRLTISDSTWDKMREAWKASIPEPYRCVGHERSANNHAYGAIIAPVPPISMLAKFFAHIFGPQHLAADQRRFKETRAKQGKRSDLKKQRLETPPTPRIRSRNRPSRAKPKPSAPYLPTIGDFCDDATI